jgi:hypothetical protein
MIPESTNGFDLDGVGLTVDDIDFDIDLPADLSPSSHDRTRWQPKGWWTTTDAESQFLDYPDFESGAQRARFIVERMARTALANTPGADDDTPLFPYGDRLVTLNQLMWSLDPAVGFPLN